MIEIRNKRITRPGQLGPEFTGDDGLGMYREGESYLIEDCIIDMSDVPLDEQDECCAVTYGAAATFKRCVIRGAGKLFLCGCGDDDKVPVETGKKVELYDCILEEFGRRGPEVQDGMQVLMHGCLIRNWGASDRFTVRNFGSWAHKGGRIDAVGCVFWQDSFWRPLKQMIADLCNHIGEAWNTEGIRGLLRLSTWIPGVCKGLLATADGEAYAWACWRNHWWIAMPWRHTTEPMSDSDAEQLIEELEQMAANLDAELPRDDGTNAA